VVINYSDDDLLEIWYDEDQCETEECLTVRFIVSLL